MLTYMDDQNQLRASAFKYDVTALASVRATEDRRTIKPPVREILFGKPEGEAEPKQYDPGWLPLDFPVKWNEVNFEFYKFSPIVELGENTLYEGFPAIYLGKTLAFLIGDDFR